MFGGRRFGEDQPTLTTGGRRQVSGNLKPHVAYILWAHKLAHISYSYQYTAQVVLGRGDNRATFNFLLELFSEGSKAVK